VLAVNTVPLLFMSSRRSRLRTPRLAMPSVRPFRRAGADLLLSAATDGAAALGASLARPRRRTAVSVKSKPVPPSITGSSSRSSLRAAPSISGVTTFTTASNKHIISVPFSTISNSLLAVLTATNYTSFGLSAVATSPFFDLSPSNNTLGGFQSYAFGVGVANIARAYARYRIKRLRLTYVPVVSTSTAGSVIIGATSENFLTTVPTPQNVADCQASLTTPVWQTASLDLTSVARINDEWLYVLANSATVAEQRQNYPCSLMASSLGIPANVSGANVAYGYIRFDGIIEFTSLSDIVGGVTAAPPARPSSPADHLSAIQSDEEDLATSVHVPRALFEKMMLSQ
jgi:hypothetical protein